MSELAAASAVFDGMEARPEWGGFGYLGERRNVRAAVESGEWPAELLTRLAALDAALLDVLGEGERAFTWANSREGRRFADWAVGSQAPAVEAVASWRADWSKRGDRG